MAALVFREASVMPDLCTDGERCIGVFVEKGGGDMIIGVLFEKGGGDMIIGVPI